MFAAMRAGVTDLETTAIPFFTEGKSATSLRLGDVALTGVSKEDISGAQIVFLCNLDDDFVGEKGRSCRTKRGIGLGLNTFGLEIGDEVMLGVVGVQFELGKGVQLASDFHLPGPIRGLRLPGRRLESL